MIVKRSVKVKMLMTPKTRQEIEHDYMNELNQIRLELEQLEFQCKKLLVDAKKKNLDTQQIAHKINQERKKRYERLERLEIKIKEMLKVPDGTELLYSTVDSYVTVEVGDRWASKIESPEIILKDGIIVEIRNE